MSFDDTFSVADFQRFCDFFYRQTGMSFVETKRYYVDKRLAERMASTGSATFAAYFGLLRSSAAELQLLISRFTVKETYFYREEHQFRCLTEQILPELLAKGRVRQPIRIWSMPCATGEEAYSIAIWLLENWPEVDAYEVEILGSDIDAEALAAAATGIYSARALMRLPPALVARYFTRLDENAWQVIDALRGSIRLSQVNLIDPIAPAEQASYHVAFCRNLLIYFDDASRRRAAANLYDALVPGGFIGLGHSESMSRISPLFEVRRFDDAIMYQKPETP
jgi:chemotaxis protein methyltransferase CheR